MSQRWTIQQLATVVERALHVGGYQGQSSGRVRTVPDPRTIRYYTTLGLLDKPAEMRGRKAFYTRRHALQLVAIKKLQAQGRSIAELQQTLAGADDETLRRWGRLPESFWSDVARPSSLATAGRSLERPPAGKSSDGYSAAAEGASRDRFWASMPVDSQPLADAGVGGADAATAKQPYQARAATHLSVVPGAELVIDDVDWRDLSEAEQGELSEALDVLASTLRRIGLESGKRAGSRPSSDNPIQAQPESEEST